MNALNEAFNDFEFLELETPLPNSKIESSPTNSPVNKRSSVYKKKDERILMFESMQIEKSQS